MVYTRPTHLRFCADPFKEEVYVYLAPKAGHYEVGTVGLTLAKFFRALGTWYVKRGSSFWLNVLRIIEPLNPKIADF